MHIGIDVGGTTTDAVIMDGRRVLGSVKRPTTEDVTGGKELDEGVGVEFLGRAVTQRQGFCRHRGRRRRRPYI